MPTYTAPTKDMSFVLHELLGVESSDVPGYEDLTPDFTSAVLEEAGKIHADVIAPLNVVGDKEGCTLENGVVRTPTGFKAAFDQFREGGWTGNLGGQEDVFSLTCGLKPVADDALRLAPGFRGAGDGVELGGIKNIDALRFSCRNLFGLVRKFFRSAIEFRIINLRQIKGSLIITKVQIP